ncbi:hypothetical protein DFH09DRAFT_1346471 [Mycena vulgaris]|nr:hypothetical protein DFH09DRAFT_1350033 [Mycena vulgaris]KAJ6465140.1 hypothetical protein DFH09DRAFT_1346471 [Mycena vulgaris]
MSPLHRMFGALTNSGTTTDPAATVLVPNGGLQLGAAFEGTDTTECGTKRPASGDIESDVRNKAKPVPAVAPGPSGVA